MKMVLIGIGNEFRGDDAVGRILARRLAAMNLPGLEVLESSGECFSLMELWTDVEKAILVDALQSGAAPGTIRRIDASTESIPADLVQQCSTHSLSLLEAVEMARALEKLPPEVVIYGVEGQSFDPGEGLVPLPASDRPADAIRGRAALALMAGQPLQGADLESARRLLGAALRELLGARPLRTREMLRALGKKGLAQ